jgi:transcriptional regulator with PAS, ATPase and Fis domain
VVTADEETIRSEQLPSEFRPARGAALEGGTLEEAKERLEAELVRQAYGRTQTCIGVAKELGISHASATRKLKKHIPGY